tara:strand:+ start:930 stop:1184 length:255 start_codon:yes stop_codon:yes gene_type:complete
MSKSKFVLEKFAKFFEEGMVNYRDFNNEIISILKSKRDEIIFKMKIATKEDTDIINKRIENLEKKIISMKKPKNKKKSKKAKKS